MIHTFNIFDLAGDLITIIIAVIFLNDYSAHTVQLMSKFMTRVVFLCVILDFLQGTSQILHATREL